MCNNYIVDDISREFRSSIAQLSDDLLWIIFELIHHVSPKTIQSLTQVSQQTRYVALQFQYHDVVLTERHLAALAIEGKGALGHGIYQFPGQLSNLTPLIEKEERSHIASKTKLDVIAWSKHFELMLTAIYMTTRHITFKTTLDWNRVAYILTRCTKLRNIKWASSYELRGPIPSEFLSHLANLPPKITLDITGSRWQTDQFLDQPAISHNIPTARLKSLECSCPFRELYNFPAPFTNLTTLTMSRCNFAQLLVFLPSSDPFPALKNLKLSVWNATTRSVARAELARFLDLMPPLQTIDITCPGRYLGFVMPDKQKELKVLRLRNNSPRTFFGDDVFQCQVFWKHGIRDLTARCTALEELGLDMLLTVPKVEACMKSFVLFKNLHSLNLRVQTRLIPSEPTVFPDHDVDLYFVNELVDAIVARAVGDRLKSISVEMGDYRKRRGDDNRGRWERMLEEGYPEKRRFEFAWVERGLFALRASHI